MNCEYITIDEIYSLKCGEFLFVFKSLSFEDSVEYCKSQNYQLAKLNIKHGKVDDNDLNKVVEQGRYKIGSSFRTGLKTFK